MFDLDQDADNGRTSAPKVKQAGKTGKTPGGLLRLVPVGVSSQLSSLRTKGQVVLEDMWDALDLDWEGKLAELPFDSRWSVTLICCPDRDRVTYTGLSVWPRRFAALVLFLVLALITAFSISRAVGK